MRFLSKWLVAASTLGLAAPASASWYVAKSRHFVIYADDNPKRLHDFADRLEKFDQGVRAALISADPEVGDGTASPSS